MQVLILDFGGQYTQLIARRVRENGIYCEIMPYSLNINRIKEIRPRAIILSGGPASVYTPNAPMISREILNLGIPVLGICYGMQLIVKLLNGKIVKSKEKEYGFNNLKILKRSKLLEGVRDNSKVWMSHQDRVEFLPPEFDVTGRTENSPFAVVESRYIYGVQFHPEVVHTVEGRKILNNFLLNVAGCKKDWNSSKMVNKIIKEVKAKVGDKKVVCAVSGGVDSTIMALLLYKAVDNNFYGIFINNGLLRKGEAREVMYNLKQRLKLPVQYINASKLFLTRLKGIISPEKKREIIGNTFIEVFFKNYKKIDFLAQGTLYPDVIESTSVVGPSAKIKTHHNRVKKIIKLMREDKVIEPFRFLFKDEVRKIGKKLGVPDDIIWRMPFPGPGLGVRIIGEVTPKRLKIVREADAIVREIIETDSDIRKIWQAFAVLLPVKSVGVMGDTRTYKNVVALRIVESTDGMTADWAKLRLEILQKISTRIINEVDGVNRVVYDISSKPPSTIEWE